MGSDPRHGSPRLDLLAYGKAIVASTKTPEVEAIVRAVASIGDSWGIRASLEGGTWLVFDLRVKEGADPDTIVADALDRVWPAWRVCVAE